MKAAALYIAIFALALLTIPMIAMNFDLPSAPEMQATVHSPVIPGKSDEIPPNNPETQSPEEPAEAAAEDPETTLAAAVSDKGVESFLILDETTGEVETVALRDFVRGAVAAEMPANFHQEALKAQAVAAHTFALHNHRVQQETPEPELKGADFSADPSNRKIYMTETQARAFYGDKADQYWAKICAAADSVLPYVLEYDEEPIVAAYHAISAGQTEDASNVWTGSAPYLAPVHSEGDILAPDYETDLSISKEELETKLMDAYPEMVLQDDPDHWFGDTTRSGSGYVVEVEVGNQSLHGKEIRQLLDLRSHNFDVSYTDQGFVFTVYGYGHGVGLSQYGADFLARQGKTFDEILSAYYTDAVLTQVEVAVE